TAFILHGVVTDAEGDALNYCWEQNNNAPASQSGANSVCSPTKLTGPNYRSFNPKTTPDRYMPDYSRVLAGTLSTTWESVSTIARSSKYTLTVRDNHLGGPQTNTDEVLVTTAAPYNGTTGVGPFQITSEATAVAWVPGATETITWAVNNTTSLPGSANVNVKMSTDGGLTFPIILAANTPNDGSESITVPSGLSQTCRLLIEPTGNYYYAVSAVNFSLGYQLVTTCTTYNYSGAAFTLANPSTSYNVKTINVPTAGTISDVNVHFNVTAANVQNLNIALIAPGVSLFPLFNQQCAGSANMDVTFDSQGSVFDCGNLSGGTMALPVGTLNTLNGGPANGNWQFGFRDLVAGDAVTINSFWLEICSSSLVPLGTKEFGFENFALYPNPNNGSFKVQFDSASGSKIGIAVFDISGRKIFDKSYSNSGMFSQDLQLDHAQSGVYLVSITDGDQKIVKRIVVE
ncbi:MAG TPA: T9SS type A sorting domain-containing protein, partial [Flavobacterium sp.]|nr:T9SS type A sorting domain-containing protein [Flavobacterium sp.]